MNSNGMTSSVDSREKLANVLSMATAVGWSLEMSDLDLELPSTCSTVAPLSRRGSAADDDKNVKTKKSSVLTPPATKGASSRKDKPAKKRTWKKPKDKPKRPLSAYNLFFQDEREKIVLATAPAHLPAEVVLAKVPGQKRRRHRKSHGKIGFAALARNIAEKWKSLDEASKMPFEAKAEQEKKRYKIELEAWNKAQEQKKAKQEATTEVIDETANTSDAKDESEEQPRKQKVIKAVSKGARSGTCVKSEFNSPLITSLCTTNFVKKGDKNTFAADCSDSTDLSDCLATVQRTIDLATSALSNSPTYRSAHSSPEAWGGYFKNKNASPENVCDEADWLNLFHPIDVDDSSENMNDDDNVNDETSENPEEDPDSLESLIGPSFVPAPLPDLGLSSSSSTKFPTFSSRRVSQKHQSIFPDDSKMQGILASLNELDATVDDDFVEFLSAFENEE